MLQKNLYFCVLLARFKYSVGKGSSTKSKLQLLEYLKGYSKSFNYILAWKVSGSV